MISQINRNIDYCVWKSFHIFNYEEVIVNEVCNKIPVGYYCKCISFIF